MSAYKAMICMVKEAKPKAQCPLTAEILICLTTDMKYSRYYPRDPGGINDFWWRNHTQSVQEREQKDGAYKVALLKELKVMWDLVAFQDYLVVEDLEVSWAPLGLLVSLDLLGHGVYQVRME